MKPMARHGGVIFQDQSDAGMMGGGPPYAPKGTKRSTASAVGCLETRVLGQGCDPGESARGRDGSGRGISRAGSRGGALEIHVVGKNLLCLVQDDVVAFSGGRWRTGSARRALGGRLCCRALGGR